MLGADRRDRGRVEDEAGAAPRTEAERHGREDAELVAVAEEQHVTGGRVGAGEHALGPGGDLGDGLAARGVAPVQTVQPANSPPRARISAVVSPSISP